MILLTNMGKKPLSTGRKNGNGATYAFCFWPCCAYLPCQKPTVAISAHSHSVSGTTANAGTGTAINVTNAFIKLMG
jgi:hypothetical protein